MSDIPLNGIAKGPYWLPHISLKQEVLMKLRKRFNLVTGPRYSTKTRGILHAITLHLWNHKYARFAMLGRTQTVNADGGPWAALHRYIIPEWIAGMGMNYVTEPKMDGATHKLYAEVSNKHGGVSIIQLDSLAVESDVDERFKGKEYSGIYMCEADNFQNRYSFDVLQECLRGVPEMKYEDYRFFLDCNPPKDGEEHWLHDLFYKFRTRENFDDEDEAVRLAMKELQDQLSVTEFTIDDNIFVSEAERRAQYAKYAHDKDLLDRFYYGKWIKATGDSIFQKHFKPMIHVNDPGPNHRDPDILLPEENCSRLGTSWDIGGSNNAAHIIEEIKVPVVVFENGIETTKEMPGFKILDEFVSIGENVSIATLTETMLNKMDEYERMCGQRVWWTHISDRSSFDRYDNISDSYEYKEIFTESNGRIELERGPVKKKGSVQARVNLIKKLLHQDRLFISHNCHLTIEMFKNIKSGKTTAIDPHSKYKHAFDSITYYICKVCFNEMEEAALLLSGKKDTKRGGLISI